jgi:hypothetical protein
MRRILSIDGGGIKGVFAAAFLATIEQSANICIRDYFDLIVGTSTGGIIALGLGLGYTATEITRFYEEYGPQIFPRRRFATLKQIFRPKFESGRLHEALTAQFGSALLGQSSVRLVIPALSLETGEVHIYKTAHHPRLELDYRVPVVDIAMATAAAPTYFEEHVADGSPALIDGGLFANNPTGLGVVEAVGILGWSPGEIQVLSVGSTTSPLDAMKGARELKGRLFYATRIVDLMMTAQSSASMGIAAVLLGHEHVHRYTVSVDRRRFNLDDTAGIGALRGLGAAEARKALPTIRQRFLTQPADPFEPYRRLEQ